MSNKSSEPKTYRFPAPWEPKDAVMLIWPGADTLSVAEEIEELYEALIAVLVDYADIIIVTKYSQFESIKNRLIKMDVCLDYVTFYESDQSSIDVSRFGPYLVEEANQFVVLHQEKNIFVSSLLKQEALPCALLEDSSLHLSCNSIESDGKDILLINVAEIQKINSHFTLSGIQDFFNVYSSQKTTLILNNEFSSDHIGLVRLSPNNQLLYLHCSSKTDPKYPLFKQRADSLTRLIADHQNKLTLCELPCESFMDEDGKEYLADYSQFVVINETVLIPTFDLPTDEDAMDIISHAFSGFDIFGFPSQILASLKTGLFNITLAIPEGVQEPL